jgi:hypothetical protein
MEVQRYAEHPYRVIHSLPHDKNTLITGKSQLKGFPYRGCIRELPALLAFFKINFPFYQRP